MKLFQFNYDKIEDHFDIIPSLAIYFHKHLSSKDSPWHFHISIQWVIWYFDIQIGTYYNE